MKPVQYQMSREAAKLSLVNSLTHAKSVPLISIWYDEKMGWTYTFDNLLKTDTTSREMTRKMVQDIINALDLFNDQNADLSNGIKAD